jgi:quinol monooxygenase YgiN
MAFVQTIEFTTDNIDGVRALGKEWEAASSGKRSATRRTIAEDRDRPGTYVILVEFPSYEAAMENSKLPETQKFSARMMEAAGSEATFRNLDVVETVDL